MSGTLYHLTHRIAVDAPPAEAFELFTPRGETRTRFAAGYPAFIDSWQEGIAAVL